MKWLKQILFIFSVSGLLTYALNKAWIVDNIQSSFIIFPICLVTGIAGMAIYIDRGKE